MPKRDPFRKLRIVEVTPTGKILHNPHINVKITQDGKLEICDEKRGMSFETAHNASVPVLARAKDPNRWPLEYTLTTGKVSLGKDAKLEVKLPPDVSLPDTSDYSIIFPKETVKLIPSLMKMIKMKIDT